MRIARNFKLNIAAFLVLFSAACGSSHHPPTEIDHVSKPIDAGTPITAVDPIDAAAPEAALDASAPITVTSSEPAAVDACNPASANFEQLVRPKLNVCYQEGKKKNPDLAGEIRVTLSFDYKGKLTSVKATGPEDLGKPVIACMLNAVKKTPFEFADSCASKAIIVGKKFGAK